MFKMLILSQTKLGNVFRSIRWPFVIHTSYSLPCMDLCFMGKRDMFSSSSPFLLLLAPPPLAPLLLPLLPPHPTVLCISDFVVTHGVFFDLRNLSGDESSFPEIPRQERQISESSQKNVSMNNWLNYLGSSMVIFGDKNVIQGHR